MTPLDTFAEDLDGPRGAWEAMNTVPALVKGTASLKLAGATEEVATTKFEALEPQAQDEAERRPVFVAARRPRRRNAWVWRSP